MAERFGLSLPMLTIRPIQTPTISTPCTAFRFATGLAGGDASHLYGDPRLMGHIYAAPYALLEPQLALVVEDGDGVAGFAVGTTDTTAWERRLEQSWWPALRERFALPAEADAAGWTPDQRRAFIIHRPAATPPLVALTYPAHLHLNLLPRLHGRGVDKFLRSLDERGEHPRRTSPACRGQPDQHWRGQILEEDGLHRPGSRWTAGRAHPLAGPSMTIGQDLDALF